MNAYELAALGSALLALGLLTWAALRAVDALEHALGRLRRRRSDRGSDAAARAFLEGKWR